MRIFVSILFLSIASAFGAALPPRVNGVPVSSEYGFLQFPGAAWNGSADDTTVINAAITTVNGLGGGVIVFPPGIGKANGQITLKAGVTLRGSGIGASTLDMTGATATDAFIYGAGSQTEIATIGANVAVGDVTTTFASAHGLAVGDVYALWNSTAGSYSAARTVYYDGGVRKVCGINGLTVTNTAPWDSAFTVGANIRVFKKSLIRCGVRDMTILFKPNTAKDGIKLRNATGTCLENLSLSGSQLANVEFVQGYDVHGRNIYAFDASDSIGNNYGLSVANTEGGSFSDCTFEVRRHGVTNGGYDEDGAVPTRHIKYSNIQANSSLSDGLDVHGNGEYIEFVNCSSPNGASFGGDHISFIGGFLGNANDNFNAVRITEPKGFDYTFNGVHFYASRAVENASGLVYFLARSWTDRQNGQIKFKSCDLDFGTQVSQSGVAAATAGIQIETSSNAATPNFGVIINDLTATSSYETVGGPVGTNLWNFSAIFISPDAAAGIRSVIINGGTFVHTGIRWKGNVQNLVVNNSTLIQPYGYSLICTVATNSTYTDQVYNINNVYCRGGQGNASLAMTTNAIAIVRNSTIFDNAKNKSSSAIANGSIYVTGGKEAWVFNNLFGDRQASPSQQRLYGADTLAYFHRGNNLNLGEDVGNALVLGTSAIVNTVTDIAPQNSGSGTLGSSLGNSFLYWDETFQSVGIGVNNQNYAVPLSIRRDTNTTVQVNISNQSASSAAGTAVNIQSSDSSGYIGTYPSTSSATHKQDSLVVGLNSNASRMVFDDPTAGQTFEWRSPSAVLAAQVIGTNLNVIGTSSINNSVSTNGVAVGGGTLVKKLLTATATLDFPSVSAASSQDLTITVTGAATGDSVFVGPPTAITSGIHYSAFVSSANTVTVRANNFTAGAIDPASATFRATVFSY